jgi:hypothetical protein
MYNLGYQLRPIIDEIRAWSRDFRTVDSIASAVFEEERDEGAEGVDKEADYDEVDDQEDDGAATHLCGLREQLWERGIEV